MEQGHKKQVNWKEKKRTEGVCVCVWKEGGEGRSYVSTFVCVLQQALTLHGWHMISLFSTLTAFNGTYTATTHTHYRVGMCLLPAEKGRSEASPGRP